MTQLMQRRAPKRSFASTALTLEQVTERYNTITKDYSYLLTDKSLEGYIRRNYIAYNGLYFER